jgi:hypothetical protein
MRLIGILIAIVLLALLFVWWMNLALNRTNQAATTTANMEQGTDTNPIDYPKQKVDEIKEETEERVEEVNQLQ